MKILFLSRFESSDIKIWSGTLYYMFRQLKKKNHVKIIGSEILNQLTIFTRGNLHDYKFIPTDRYIKNVDTFINCIKMKPIFFIILFFYIGLLNGQTYPNDYNQFTPERRIVLNKMGEFFIKTIRENFPAESDELSYINFHNCFWQTGSDGFYIVLHIDMAKIKEINQILFKDHNYYFFYTRVIDMWQVEESSYSTPLDSIPTTRIFGKVKRKKYQIQTQLNRNGYMAVPEDNPVIMNMKRIYSIAGDLSPGSFYSDELIRDLSKPVKEYLSVIFWKYLCILAGVDLEERKSICETCFF